MQAQTLWGGTDEKVKDELCDHKPDYRSQKLEEPNGISPWGLGGGGGGEVLPYLLHFVFLDLETRQEKKNSCGF